MKINVEQQHQHNTYQFHCHNILFKTLNRSLARQKVKQKLKQLLIVCFICLFAKVEADCTVTAPNWTLIQNLITLGNQSQIQISDNQNLFVKTGSTCSSVTLWNVSALFADGTPTNPNFATIVNQSAQLSNIQVLIKPANQKEATGEISVSVQAVDQATRAFGQICFMYRPSTSTNNFCCPPNFDNTGCLSCAPQQFVAQNTAFQSQILALSKGCALCDAKNNFYPFLYLNSATGSVMRGCQQLLANYVTKEDDQCSFGSIYVKQTNIDGSTSLTCTACTDVIDNCPLCSSQYTCLNCAQGTGKVTLKNAYSQNYDMCTNNWCYGCTICSSSIPQCLVCDRANTAICQKCQSGYYLSQDQKSCLQQKSQFQLDLYLLQYSGIHMPDPLLAQAKSATGTSLLDPYYFIQQAYNSVYTQKNLNQYLNTKVNVWLGLGDHFFFQCYGYNSNYGTNDKTQITQYCNEIANLQAVYPSLDNIDFFFQPLLCSLLNNPAYPQFNNQNWSAAMTTAFQNNCVYPAFQFAQRPDPGPRVHIMDNHAYFNVTGSMSFNSIEFRGENALSYLPAGATSFPLNTIPVRLCQVLDADEQAITGAYQKIILTTNQNVLPQKNFVCGDQGFNDANIPMNDYETCKLNSDGTGFSATYNVNRFPPNCKFEPYRKEFFNQDPLTKIYFQRQQVLFNLYGFSSDQKSAYSLNKVPSLNLINCKFKFFLKDYDALINIENNNFVQITQQDIDKPILAKFGSDKGGRVYTSKSQFSNSRFCKGMISFKKSPSISAKQLKNLFFQANAQGQPTTVFQFGYEPGIYLTDSTMLNLNWGKATQYLSLEDQGILTMYGYQMISYPPFDNLGVVINMQGFPGGIELLRCTMQKNMVFIPDIFPSLRTQGFDFQSNTVKAAINELQQYKDDNLFQFKLKKCDSFRVRRLFSDFLSSFKDHHDQLLVQMERQSTVYISKPELPVIFENNTFSDNIGIFGGAIFVDSPNYQVNGASSMNYITPNLRPQILIKDNLFLRNSAYSSGNAVYLRGTRVRDTQWNESWQTCAGFFIQSNEFTNNTAVTKSHNGGAITVACDFIDPNDSRYLNATSNFANGTQVDQTLFISDYLTNDQYKVYRQATGIINNTFNNNTSSQKGLAIYTRHLQNLFIKDNTFDYNQPHFTYAEYTFNSTYYSYLAQRQRYASFYDEKQRDFTKCPVTKIRVKVNTSWMYCQAVDEFDYMQNYATTVYSDGLIDWPQVQGTIHIENCDVCLVSYFVENSGCNFCHQLVQYSEIRNNTFTNNQGGFSFYQEANAPKASQIFISGGGASNHIVSNMFFNVTQQVGAFYFNMIKVNLTSYYNATFPGYWDLQQTPLVYVQVPQTINILINNTQSNTWAVNNTNYANSSAYNQSLSATFFEFNSIVSVVSVQPFIETNKYKGSIVHLESQSLYANLTVQNNWVEDSYVIGQDAALFYVNGGSLFAFNNQFERIGSLTNGTYKQNPTNGKTLLPIMNGYNYTEPAIYAPYFGIPFYPNVTVNLTMDRGIFWFEAGAMNRTNVSLPLVNQFFNNTFKYIYCVKGCIYTTTIKKDSHPTRNIHKQNYYRNIFGINGAIQLTTVEDQNPRFDLQRGKNYTYSVQEYSNETIINVQNGAFVTIGKQNEVVQFFNDVYFQNVFGSMTSSSIYMEHGAGVYCNNCTFQEKLAQGQRLLYVMIEYQAWLSKIVIFQFNRKFFNDFISNSTMNSSFGSGPSSQGAIQLKNVTQSYQIINPQNITLVELDPNPVNYILINYCAFNFTDYVCKSLPKWDGSLKKLAFSEFQVTGMRNQTYSVIKNSNFYNLSGNLATSMYLENTNILIENSNFKYSVGSQGTGSTTVQAVNSNVTFDEVIFDGNQADNGAAIHVTQNSNLTILYSVFYQNTAFQSAGAILAEENSNITIRNSVFQENESKGNGGALVLKNILNNQATINNSNFTRNIAQENLITMYYSQMSMIKCSFSDNFSQEMTHGISLHGSYLQTDTITIWQKFDNMPSMATQVQSGFFLLTSSSRLDLTGKSFIQHCYGQIAAVILLQANSFLFVQKALFFDILGLDAVNLPGTGVIVAQQSKNVIIDQTIFHNCDNVNVYAVDTPVTITQSEFKYGLRLSYVSVQFSQLTISQTNFYSAKDNLSLGRGIQCIGCYNVNIYNNLFKELNSMRGGAIYLENTSNANIMNNNFLRNSAQQGGAIYVYYSEVNIRNNNFTNNSAIQNSHFSRSPRADHQGAGGAIFFTCVNLQDSNSYYHPEPQFDYLGNYINTTLYNNTKPNCTVDLGNNLFLVNKASGKAGAIMYTNVNFTESTFNNYTNNTSPNGNVVSSPPSRIEISQNTLKSKRRLKDIYEIVSGQEMNLQITLFNKEGDIYADDNSTVAELVFSKTPAFGVIKGNNIIAKNGIFNFTSLLIQMQPGNDATIVLNILNLETYGNLLDFLENPIQINLHARYCQVGEQMTKDRTCVPCPQGYYSLLSDIKEPSVCKPCPEFAICLGGADMTPIQGFVRVDETSIIFLRCLNEQACILPDYQDKLGKCDSQKGYQGYMCSECAKGFWRRENTYQCQKCTNSNLFRFVWIILIVFLFCIFLIIWRIFIRNFDKKNQMTVPVIRMMITYYQFFSIMSKLEIYQTSQDINFFIKLINIRAYLMTPAEIFFDLQCMNKLTNEEKYYALIVFQTLLPLLIYGVCFIFSALASCCSKCRRNQEDRRQRRSICNIECSKLVKRTQVATCILMYIVYPTMVEQLLSSVHCFKQLKMGPGDVVISRLRSHPDILCDSKNYKWFKGFVFVPGILVWVVLLPLFVMRRFYNGMEDIVNSENIEQVEDYNKKKNAEDIKAQYGFMLTGLKICFDMKFSERNEDKSSKQKKEFSFFEACFMRIKSFFKIIYSFLQTVVRTFRGQPQCINLRNDSKTCQSFFHWEIIVFFSKFTLILVEVFGTDINKNFQLNLSLVVFATLIFIQSQNSPYQRAALNNMHFALLSTLLIVTYTHDMLKDFTGGYNKWRQKQVVQGLDPISQELGVIARIYKFNTNSNSYIYDVFVYIVIVLTFGMDLYFVYHLYIQMLLYLKVRQKTRLLSWLTCKNQTINNLVSKAAQQFDREDSHQDEEDEKDKDSQSNQEEREENKVQSQESSKNHSQSQIGVEDDEDVDVLDDSQSVSRSESIDNAEKYKRDLKNNIYPAPKRNDEQLLSQPIKSQKPQVSTQEIASQLRTSNQKDGLTARSNIMNSSRPEFDAQENQRHDNEDGSEDASSSDQDVSPSPVHRRSIMGAKKFFEQQESESTQRSLEETQKNNQQRNNAQVPVSVIKDQFNEFKSPLKSPFKVQAQVYSLDNFFGSKQKTPGSRYVTGNLGNLNDESQKSDQEKSTIQAKRVPPFNPTGQKHQSDSVKDVDYNLEESESTENKMVNIGNLSRRLTGKKMNQPNQIISPSQSQVQSSDFSESQQSSQSSYYSTSQSQSSKSDLNQQAPIKLKQIKPEIQGRKNSLKRQSLSSEKEPQDIKSKQSNTNASKVSQNFVVFSQGKVHQNQLRDSKADLLSQGSAIKGGIFSQKRDASKSKSPEDGAKTQQRKTGAFGAIGSMFSKKR